MARPAIMAGKREYGGGGSKTRAMHCHLAGKNTKKGKKGHPKLANCKRNAKGPNRKQ